MISLCSNNVNFKSVWNIKYCNWNVITGDTYTWKYTTLYFITIKRFFYIINNQSQVRIRGILKVVKFSRTKIVILINWTSIYIHI